MEIELSKVLVFLDPMAMPKEMVGVWESAPLPMKILEVPYLNVVYPVR